MTGVWPPYRRSGSRLAAWLHPTERAGVNEAARWGEYRAASLRAADDGAAPGAGRLVTGHPTSAGAAGSSAGAEVFCRVRPIVGRKASAVSAATAIRGRSRAVGKHR